MRSSSFMARPTSHATPVRGSSPYAGRVSLGPSSRRRYAGPARSVAHSDAGHDVGVSLRAIGVNVRTAIHNQITSEERTARAQDSTETGPYRSVLGNFTDSQTGQPENSARGLLGSPIRPHDEPPMLRSPLTASERAPSAPIASGTEGVAERTVAGEG